MEIVNFLAAFWGFSFIIISLAFLIKPSHIENVIELIQNKKNLLVYGIVNIMMGVASILLYNVWDSSWKVVVTAIAWLVAIKGIMSLFFPDKLEKGVEKIKKHKDWFSGVLVAWVILGCALVYLGFNS